MTQNRRPRTVSTHLGDLKKLLKALNEENHEKSSETPVAGPEDRFTIERLEDGSIHIELWDNIDNDLENGLHEKKKNNDKS